MLLKCLRLNEIIFKTIKYEFDMIIILLLPLKYWKVSHYTILVVICASYNCACFEHNIYERNFIFRLPWYNTHWWTTACYCDPWGIYILYFDSKTFAPQCEVKIVVFIVCLLMLILLSYLLFYLLSCWVYAYFCLPYAYFCYYFVWYYNVCLFLFLLLFCLVL